MSFEDAARKYLDAVPDDDDWDEYNWALDHDDFESVADLACWFYEYGVSEAKTRKEIDKG